MNNNQVTERHETEKLAQTKEIMVILSNSPNANRFDIYTNPTTNKDLKEKISEASTSTTIMESPNHTPPKTSIDTSLNGVDPSIEFVGDVETNNELPSQEMLRKVESMIVLDKDGKARPFKSLYSGPNVARRVLVIFIRHFFCGVSFFLRLMKGLMKGWRDERVDDGMNGLMEGSIVYFVCSNQTLADTYFSLPSELPGISQNSRSIRHRRFPPSTSYSYLYRHRRLRQSISNPHVPRSHELSISDLRRSDEEAI